MKIDENATIINGYDNAFVQGSVHKIYEGLRYAYDSKHFLLYNEKESILKAKIAPWSNSKTEPNEEDIRGELIVGLISNEDNYSNADGMCICSKCEIKGMCNYVNTFQRLGIEQGGLGLCYKLNRFTFYDYVESHLEKYKLLIDTRREKRNYIEVELLPILQKFDNKIISTDYQIYYHEEYLNIRYIDKSVRLYITDTSLEGIKELVRKEILNVI